MIDVFYKTNYLLTKINTKINIAGFPPLKVRGLLRRFDYFHSKNVASHLKINIEEAEKLLEELTQLDYLVKEENQKYFTHHKTTKGCALTLARAVPSITKEKAEKLFSDFMDRVKEINSNDIYLYKVRKVVLFGSYITDALCVNDIDIAIEIVSKELNWKIRKAKEDAKRNDATEKGIQFRSFMDELSYPRTEVFKFLRSKSRYLSFDSLDDEILEHVKTIQVFPNFCRFPLLTKTRQLRLAAY